MLSNGKGKAKKVFPLYEQGKSHKLGSLRDRQVFPQDIG